MAQPLEKFIRKTGLTAGVFNLVLNPFFAWLSNRSMADVPLTPSASLDTIITCLIMSVLVSVFICAETRRVLKAGGLKISSQAPRANGLLRRLPKRPWRLGLLLGIGAALVVTPWLIGLFSLFAVTSLPFFAFALLKAVYTPLLAYAVARWVILRTVAAAEV